MKVREPLWARNFFRWANAVLEKRMSLRVIRSKPAKTVPTGMEISAIEALTSVRHRTMTDELMQYATYSAARYVAQAQIAGDVVECGVWRGGCSMLMALGLISASDTSRELWLFDTYEGMTAPGERDIFLSNGTTAEVLLEESRQIETALGEWTYWCVADEEDVLQGMIQTQYPPSKLHLVRGPIEMTLLGRLPKQISIARLDTDWYESTKMELELLYDRISVGGVLILDDYDDWAGARAAVDEFFAERGITPFLIKTGAGRIHIKLR